MTIRTVSLTGLLLAGLAVPSLADDAALAPHELNFDRPVETDSIVIQDLSGGVGSQDANSGSGNMIQIMQVQPNGSTNGVSTSSSATRYGATGGRNR